MNVLFSCTDNCEQDRRAPAAVWCFECYGFFCEADDQKIHSIGIFRHHTRDSDSAKFGMFAHQAKQGATINEMLRAGGHGSGASLADLQAARVKQRYGNVGSGADQSSAKILSAAKSALYGSSAYDGCVFFLVQW